MQVMLQACRMAAVPQMGITTHSGRAVDRFAEDAATTKMAGVRVKMRSMLVAKGAAVAQAVWAGDGGPRVVGLSRRARNRRPDRRIALRFELSRPGR
jgi:hypothetical protein